MAAKVLSKFDQIQLYKMARQENIKGEEDDSSKKLIETLSSAIEEVGLNHVTEGMKRETLEKLATPLDILKEGEKATNKQVIRKILVITACVAGLAEFFSRKDLDEEKLTYFLEVCPTDEDAEEGKKNLAKQVTRLVAEAGLGIFFGRFDVAFLQDLMDSCKLKYNTDNKNALALALATQTEAKKEKKKGGASKPKFSKTKKDIEKGISYQDIFQHYYANDLKEYCKVHDLKNSGNKKEMINRILAFLDGDVEGTKAGATGSPKKRKRSSSASGEKKKTAKKTTKKATKKRD